MRIRIRFATGSKTRKEKAFAVAASSLNTRAQTVQGSSSAYLEASDPGETAGAYLREDAASASRNLQRHGEIYARHNRRLALAAATLLTAAALMAGVLGLWRIGSDLKWTSGFAIPTGLFSHWQVWLGAAFALQVCAHILQRYGSGGNKAVS